MLPDEEIDQLIKKNDQAAFDILFNDAKQQIKKESYYDCDPTTIHSLAEFGHNDEWQEKTIHLLSAGLEDILTRKDPDPISFEDKNRVSVSGNFFAITAAAVVLGKLGNKTAIDALTLALSRIENRNAHAHNEAGGFIALALGVLGADWEIIRERLNSSHYSPYIQSLYNYATWIVTQDADAALADLKTNHCYAHYAAAAIADMQAVDKIEALSLSLSELESFFLRKVTVAAIEQLKQRQEKPQTKDLLVWRLDVQHPAEGPVGAEVVKSMNNYKPTTTLYPQASVSSFQLNEHSTDAEQRTMVNYLFNKISRQENHLSQIEALPLNKMDLSLKNEYGYTPLHAAIEAAYPNVPTGKLTEQKKVVQLILKHTQDINTLDDYKSTPLYSAVYLCDVDVIGWLLDKGADPRLSNNNLLGQIQEKTEEFEEQGDAIKLAQCQVCATLLRQAGCPDPA